MVELQTSPESLHTHGRAPGRLQKRGPNPAQSRPNPRVLPGKRNPREYLSENRCKKGSARCSIIKYIPCVCADRRLQHNGPWLVQDGRWKPSPSPAASGAGGGGRRLHSIDSLDCTMHNVLPRDELAQKATWGASLGVGWHTHTHTPPLKTTTGRT